MRELAECSCGRGTEMSKLHIVPCTIKEASDFVNKYHRHHNASVSGKFCIAVGDDTIIHGVAMCGRPVSRMLDDGFTIEINRVCTDGEPNACSMLYGACCRIAKAMGYSKIVTYTLESECGSSLKASNFQCEGRAGGTHWNGIRNKGQGIPNEMKNRWTKDLGNERIDIHWPDESIDETNQLSLFEEAIP